MLPAYLDGLTHSAFRTAGYLLGEQVLPQLDSSEFWEVLSLLIDYNSKAFLVTGMKAAANRVGEFRLPQAERLWARLSSNETDASKTLLTLLPKVKDDIELARHLLNVMTAENAEKRIAILLRIETPEAAFLLLKSLRLVEHDRSLLVRTTCFLIKRGDALSFNLASLFKSFFGLDEVRGTFSLSLQPYELDRLENHYETFLRRVVNA